MTQARGSQTYLYNAVETTFGTLAANFDANRLAIEIPYASESIEASSNLVASAVINTTRNPKRPMQGVINVGGDLTTELNPHMYWLFRHLLGAATTLDDNSVTIAENDGTVGTAPYTHTFTISNLPTSFSLEKRFESFSSGKKYWQYLGCRISRAKFTNPIEGAVTVTLTIAGADETRSTSTMSGNSNYDKSYEHRAFHAFELAAADIKIGNTIAASTANSTITTMDFEISNPLDEAVRVLGGQGIRKALPEGVTAVSGSLTMMFDSDNLSLADDIASGVKKALTLTYTRGTGSGAADNESIEFRFPELLFSRSSPKVQTDTGIYVSYNFMGFYEDDTADATACKVILKNSTPPRY